MRVHDEVYWSVGVDRGSKLPQFTSIGSNTILYLTFRDRALCACCASAWEDETDPVMRAALFDEGDPIDCEECEREIESSYGPVSK